MNIRFTITVCIGALAVSACATSNEAVSDYDPSSDPRVGAEVNRICFPRNINGWSTIDEDDSAIILTEGVNDDFRVEFAGPCNRSDFQFAQTIGIENRPGGGCLTRGDRLLVRGAGDFINRCLITRINEWDEDAGLAAQEDVSE